MRRQLRQFELLKLTFDVEGMNLYIFDKLNERPYTIGRLNIEDVKFLTALNSFRMDVNEICELNLDSEDEHLISPEAMSFTMSPKNGLKVVINVSKKLIESGDAWKFKTPTRFERHRDGRLMISEEMMTRIENLKDQVNRIVKEGKLISVDILSREQLLFPDDTAA